MPSPKLKLYVDTVSPFGYLAYYVLRNDPVFSKVDITYVPVLLGGIMKTTGNRPPLVIKNKDKWIGLERLRWAKVFNVPMKEEMPPGFPSNTLPIMRVLCALTVVYPGQKGQDLLIKCLDVLSHAYWIDLKNTIEKDVLADLLSQALGAEDAEKILEMAGKEGKEVLEKNTDLALADGAFGLPYFVATNSKGETESYWGVDHLGQVTNHLGLEKPNTGGWKAML